MRKSSNEQLPRFLTDGVDTYRERALAQLSDTLDQDLRTLTHVPESDEVLAMEVGAEYPADISDAAKAALVLADRALRGVSSSRLK